MVTCQAEGIRGSERCQIGPPAVSEPVPWAGQCALQRTLVSQSGQAAMALDLVELDGLDNDAGHPAGFAHVRYFASSRSA